MAKGFGTYIALFPQLTAKQNGNTIEIHGEADNLGAKQNAMKTITEKVGDTAGVMNLIQVASETAATPNQPSTSGGMASASSGGRTHTVQPGETLTGIAQKYYGKASEYTKIFEANRDKLSDPDRVREGTTLRIP